MGLMTDVKVIYEIILERRVRDADNFETATVTVTDPKEAEHFFTEGWKDYTFKGNVFNPRSLTKIETRRTVMREAEEIILEPEKVQP